MKILTAIQWVEDIFNSNASWSVKSKHIFDMHRKNVVPALQRSELKLDDWVTSFDEKETVTNYVTVLLALRTKLLKY